MCSTLPPCHAGPDACRQHLPHVAGCALHLPTSVLAIPASSGVMHKAMGAATIYICIRIHISIYTHTYIHIYMLGQALSCAICRLRWCCRGGDIQTATAHCTDALILRSCCAGAEVRRKPGALGPERASSHRSRSAVPPADSAPGARTRSCLPPPPGLPGQVRLCLYACSVCSPVFSNLHCKHGGCCRISLYGQAPTQAFTAHVLHAMSPALRAWIAASQQLCGTASQELQATAFQQLQASREKGAVKATAADEWTYLCRLFGFCYRCSLRF